MILIKNPKITTIIVALSIIAGCISFFSTPTYYVYRYEYEMYTTDENKCDDFLKSDTLYYSNGTLIRNFKTSISDTSRNLGIKRHELKIYHSAPANDSIISLIGSNLLKGNPCKLYNIKFEGKKIPYQQIFNYLLAGLLIVGLINWLSLFKHK